MSAAATASELAAAGTSEDARRQADRLLAQGRPFAAHEVLEERWKRCPPEERAVWRGLAQLMVGLTHHQRGNAVGAGRLLLRGADTLQESPTAGSAGVDVDDWSAWARKAARAVEQGGQIPPGPGL